MPVLIECLIVRPTTTIITSDEFNSLLAVAIIIDSMILIAVIVVDLRFVHTYAHWLS